MGKAGEVARKFESTRVNSTEVKQGETKQRRVEKAESTRKQRQMENITICWIHRWMIWEDKRRSYTERNRKPMTITHRTRLQNPSLATEPRGSEFLRRGQRTKRSGRKGSRTRWRSFSTKGEGTGKRKRGRSVSGQTSTNRKEDLESSPQAHQTHLDVSSW